MSQRNMDAYYCKAACCRTGIPNICHTRWTCRCHMSIEVRTNDRQRT